MRNIVKKRNQVINGRYNLTLNEQKLILLSITQIKQEDLLKDNKIYKIKLSDIDKKMNKQNRTRIKDFTNKILQKVIFIEKENKGFLAANWFSSIEYLHEEQELEIMFDNKIKPYFFELTKNFTSYNINEILTFKSSYSVRFYEMLIQLKNTKHKERIFEIDEIYKILDLPASLQKISKFKTEILEKVLKDINEKSNIYMFYEFIKNGRKFTHLKLSFKQNNIVIENRKIKTNSSEYHLKNLQEFLEMKDFDLTVEENFYHFFNCIQNVYIDQLFLFNSNKYRLDDIEYTKREKNSDKDDEFILKVVNQEDQRTANINTNIKTCYGLHVFLLEHQI